MTDVRRIADLAGLAVADDVDADFRLLRDDIVDARLHRRIECRLVVRLTTVLGEEKIDDFLRPRQAAHVRRENPICARFHPDLRGGTAPLIPPYISSLLYAGF